MIRTVPGVTASADPTSEAAGAAVGMSAPRSKPLPASSPGSSPASKAQPTAATATATATLLAEWHKELDKKSEKRFGGTVANNNAPLAAESKLKSEKGKQHNENSLEKHPSPVVVVDDDAEDGENMTSLIGSSNDDLCVMERQLNMMEEEIMGWGTDLEGELAAMRSSFHSDVQADADAAHEDSGGGEQSEDAAASGGSSSSSSPPSPRSIDELHRRYGSFISELHSRHSAEIREWSERLRERTDERDGALSSLRGLERKAVALQAKADGHNEEMKALKKEHKRHVTRLEREHALEIKELKKQLKSAWRNSIDCVRQQPPRRRSLWGAAGRRNNSGRRLREHTDEELTAASTMESSDGASNDGSCGEIDHSANEHSNNNASSSTVDKHGEGEGEDSRSKLEIVVTRESGEDTTIAELKRQLLERDSEIKELTAANAAQASALYVEREESLLLRSDREAAQSVHDQEVMAIHEHYGTVIAELEKTTSAAVMDASAPLE